jgi:hypothetical protein
MAGAVGERPTAAARRARQEGGPYRLEKEGASCNVEACDELDAAPRHRPSPSV